MKCSLALVLCLLTGSYAFTTSGVLQQSLTATSSSFETTDSSALTSAVEAIAGKTEGLTVEEETTSTEVSVENKSEGFTNSSTPETEPESTGVSTKFSETSKIPDSKELTEISKSFKALQTPGSEVARAETPLLTATESSMSKAVEFGGNDFTSVSAEVPTKVDSTNKLPEVAVESDTATTNASSESSMTSETTSKAVETTISSLEEKTSTTEESHENGIILASTEIASQDNLITQLPEVETVSKVTSIDTSSGSHTALEVTSEPIETSLSTLEVKATATDESGGVDITLESTTITPEVGTKSEFTSADTLSGSSTPFEATSEPVETSTSTLEAKTTTAEESDESEFTLTTSIIPKAISEPDETLVPFVEVETSAVDEGDKLIRALIVLCANELQVQKDAEKAKKVKDTLMKLVQLCYQYVGSARQHECTPWIK